MKLFSKLIISMLLLGSLQLQSTDTYWQKTKAGVGHIATGIGKSITSPYTYTAPALVLASGLLTCQAEPKIKFGGVMSLALATGAVSVTVTAVRKMLKSAQCSPRNSLIATILKRPGLFFLNIITSGVTLEAYLNNEQELKVVGYLAIPLAGLFWHCWVSNHAKNKIKDKPKAAHPVQQYVSITEEDLYKPDDFSDDEDESQE